MFYPRTGTRTLLYKFNKRKCTTLILAQCFPEPSCFFAKNILANCLASSKLSATRVHSHSLVQVSWKFKFFLSLLSIRICGTPRIVLMMWPCRRSVITRSALARSSKPCIAFAHAL